MGAIRVQKHDLRGVEAVASQPAHPFNGGGKLQTFVDELKGDELDGEAQEASGSVSGDGGLERAICRLRAGHCDVLVSAERP